MFVMLQYQWKSYFSHLSIHLSQCFLIFIFCPPFPQASSFFKLYEIPFGQEKPSYFMRNICANSQSMTSFATHWLRIITYWIPQTEFIICHGNIKQGIFGLKLSTWNCLLQIHIATMYESSYNNKSESWVRSKSMWWWYTVFLDNIHDPVFI